MSKRCFKGLLAAFFLIFLGACSSSDSEESKSMNDMAQMDKAADSNEIAVLDEEDQSTVEETKDDQVNTSDRMIIHRANLEVRVKSLDKAQQNIEKKVKEYGGYIVESNEYRDENEMKSGNVIVRVPEKQFQAFLNDTEDEVAEVMGRNVSGQDVTEEYVDLESRLKSKRAVEERLLSFMKEAQKTEDLLKISSDLAKVQEEIEVLVGKVKYLENQTAFSTVEISMQESKVVVPGVGDGDLDTWEKTKKQLAVSLNFLLAAASGMVVFFVGNLPVILLLVLIGVGIFYLVKRKRRKLKE
ncbi:DUF4349 domain-containing protein [Siminovitchia terrae]|uniref:DUF4349 domain-containing protein n=1 Tax=Siminovitchia terrae TaxID=1914933 RepID=A0A429X2L3_SIMTE|nr:DUF4349 domain-containing protein [Siminovitchia terrae]RST57430.1 DUF4349 domain-containing protein [Siminovitchia terrae]